MYNYYYIINIQLICKYICNKKLKKKRIKLKKYFYCRRSAWCIAANSVQGCCFSFTSSGRTAARIY